MKVKQMELPTLRIPSIFIHYNEEEKEEIIVDEKTLALEAYKKEIKALKYINLFFKRLIDIMGAIVGIMILIPLTIVIFVVNKITGDGGPIFYTQERIGKDGKTFKMLKYRSMVVGADEKLEEYLKNNEEARLEYQKYKKLTNDPRVTKIGNILRKTSLDEMPQLIHLLDGKMSLVGPRPYLPREKEDMGEYYNIVIKHKPGITGLWQVSGRSNATFDERLDMDVIYDEKHSFIYDVKILIGTFIKIIKKEGAV